jgi:hypothetical protein
MLLFLHYTLTLQSLELDVLKMLYTIFAFVLACTLIFRVEATFLLHPACFPSCQVMQ